MQPLHNGGNDFNAGYSKHKDPAGFMSPLKIDKVSWVSSTSAHHTVLIGDLSKRRAWRGRERHLEVERKRKEGCGWGIKGGLARENGALDGDKNKFSNNLDNNVVDSHKHTHSHVLYVWGFTWNYPPLVLPLLSWQGNTIRGSPFN